MHAMTRTEAHSLNPIVSPEGRSGTLEESISLLEAVDNLICAGLNGEHEGAALSILRSVAAARSVELLEPIKGVPHADPH